MKKYLLSLAAQFLFSLILAFGIYLLKPLNGLHAALKWVLYPFFCGVSAFMLVKKGLNPYVSWLLPPLALVPVATFMTGGYLPEGGLLLLTSFIGIVGAATSENYMKFRKRRHK